MFKNAVFYDLDGTLWDSLDQIVESYNLSMKKHGYDVTCSKDDIRKMMGFTPIDIVRALFKDKSLEEGIKLFKEFYIDELNHLKSHPGIIYDGVIDMLKELSSKYSLFIVSNSDKGYVENFINVYNLSSYFKGYIQAGDTNQPKSSNILYLKNKYKLDKVIYVGDTIKDQKACLKVNVPFIYASYGFGEVKNYQYKIDSPIDLINLLNNINF